MIFIMFSLGLNLTAKDFLEVVKKPRNLIIALICQMIILPVIGIIIILSVDLLNCPNLQIVILLPAYFNLILSSWTKRRVNSREGRMEEII